MNTLRIRAISWLLLFIVIAGCSIAQFSGKIPLQTNLLALLPATERNPLAEQAITKLAEANGNRAVFLVGMPTLEKAGDAARFFAAGMRESSVFRHIVAEVPPFDVKQITDLYLKYRFNLLSAPDRSAFQSNSMDLEERFQRKLYAPFRFGLTLPVADDPFGLSDAWLSGLPLKNFRLEPRNGFLMTYSPGKVWVLIAGELSGSAYDNDLQQRLSSAITNTENKLLENYPEVEILRAGMVFYANAARADAESEMDFIGLVSTLGIVLLLYLVFRSFYPLALGLFTVGAGILTAIVLCVSVFGELHLITLVFGASLIGDAIDYPIQYFCARLGAGDAWEPTPGLHRIAPGLTTALLVGLLGYGSLMLLPFPALVQISLFSMTGLAATWLTVMLLLPFLLKSPDSCGTESVILALQRLLIWFQAAVGKKECLFVALFVFVLMLPGCFLLTGSDDIHLLVSRSPALAKQEDRIRTLTGYSAGSQFFLVEGKTPDEMLANEERLAEKLSELVGQKVISGFQGISSFVPSREQQIQNRLLLGKNVFSDREKLRRLFDQAGLHDRVTDELLADFDASKEFVLRVEDWMKTPFSTPYRHLWLGENPQGFASVVLPTDIRDLEKLGTLAAGLESVTFVDKVGSVSRLFQSYRQMSVSWLFYAVCLIYGVLFLRYGGLHGAYVLMPALLSLAISLGVFGYAGIPMTLFNVMGLMLILCAGVNYAIFMREGGVKVAATLAGVLLSSITDLLSFGLLAFSSTPALSGFGLTLLLGIGSAILLTPAVLILCGDGVS